MTSLNVGSVKINHLNKSYGQYQEQALTVLDDISLEIKSGEFGSIVGSSGCGKSTL